MELDRMCAEIGEVEALDGPVVERDVRRLRAFGRLDGEAVVLARDEHAAGSTLEHGVVRAAVAERELVRAMSRRKTEKLMTEADAEHWRPAEQIAHDRRLLLERLGVAWAVRE